MASITFTGPSATTPGTIGTKTVTLPDDLMVTGIAALCDAYKYPVNVANPNFNSGLPADPTTNPATIPNPDGPDVFAVKQVLGFLSNHALAYTTRVAQQQEIVQQAIQAAVNQTQTQLSQMSVA